MTQPNLTEFLLTYVPPPDTTRIVLDLDMDKHEGPSPFIIVRHQGRTMILNPMALSDHLCVDAHAFVAGEAARTGVFGMEDGFRASLDDDQVKGTSHGWAATKLVALLLGKQEDK